MILKAAHGRRPPADPNFNSGRGVPNHCQQMATSNLLSGISGLSAVLPLGDLQYEDGSSSRSGPPRTRPRGVGSAASPTR